MPLRTDRSIDLSLLDPVVLAGIVVVTVLLGLGGARDEHRHHVFR
ncbi:MAG: hypothetical protein RIE53_00200 [Rhodothermales bacterium]